MVPTCHVVFWERVGVALGCVYYFCILFLCLCWWQKNIGAGKITCSTPLMGLFSCCFCPTADAGREEGSPHHPPVSFDWQSQCLTQLRDAANDLGALEGAKPKSKKLGGRFLVCAMWV